MSLRLFVALHLERDIRERLSLILDYLRFIDSSGRVRWVHPDSIHLTLRFLGETEDGLLPDLVAGLGSACAGHAGIQLGLGMLGAFPNLRRPRVIWAGLRGDLPAVESLQAQVEAVATRLGWVPESRPFQPHLTLGRVVNPRSHLGDSIALLDMSEHQETIPHTRVALVRCHLGPAGARYEDLAVWELGS